jgi:transketolase
VANGTVLWRAIGAADLLAAEGISARVLSMATVKPLDVDAIVVAAEETGAIVTVEEAIATGGLGGAVAETVVTEHPVPMAMLGFEGFCTTGPAAYLIDKAGMSPEGIAEVARRVMARKR